MELSMNFSFLIICNSSDIPTLDDLKNYWAEDDEHQELRWQLEMFNDQPALTVIVDNKSFVSLQLFQGDDQKLIHDYIWQEVRDKCDDDDDMNLVREKMSKSKFICAGTNRCQLEMEEYLYVDDFQATLAGSYSGVIYIPGEGLYDEDVLPMVLFNEFSEDFYDESDSIGMEELTP